MDHFKFLSCRANRVEPSPIRETVKQIAEYQKKGVKVISFAAGDPDPNLIPREALGEIAKELLEREPRSVTYSPSTGIPELREELSRFVEKYDGVRAPPENIVITVGGQEALDLIGRMLIDPGDVVITENPSYVNTLLAFKQFGAQIIGVPVDEEGMKTDALENTVKKLVNAGKKIKAIYTIPVGHNPMGVTMSLERRKHLLEIASAYDLLIIEDNAYNYLRYEETNIPTLKSMDKEGRVIMEGTLSKVIGTGFRVGWIIADGLILKKIATAKQPSNMCTPSLSQFIAYEYLKRGYFEKYHKEAVKVYREKKDAMISALEENLNEAKYTKPIAGMFIMLWLPKSCSGEEFAKELLKKHHVAVVPGGPFYTDKSGKNTVRLNFSRPSKKEIAEGIEKLAGLYREGGIRV